MISDLFLGAAVAAVTSLGACRLVMSAGLWDAPHLARHQHREPTPTSGGLGVAAGYALGVLAIIAWSLISWRDWLDEPDATRLAVATAFASFFLVIGFLDDTYPLGPRGKFLTFATVSFSAAWFVGVAHVFPIGPGVTVDIGLPLGLIGSALWVFTLVNCVNFMDGANGLAMGSVAVGLAGLALVASEADAPDAAMMALCGVGALAGFLVWNFPGGRLFAGDSGALFAGALAALASLIAIQEGAVSPFIPPMLFFPLLADALLTLAFRVRQKRNVLHGHADHLYQIALRAQWAHGAIALAYWAATAGCVGVALFVSRAGGAWTPLAFAGLALTAIVIAALVRRAAKVRGILDAPER